MIKEYLETAIQNIEAKKQEQISQITEKVKQEKIVPFNQEIEDALSKAYAQLEAEANTKIYNIQKELSEKKLAMREGADKKKEEYAEHTIAMEVSNFKFMCDTAIEKLRKQIDEVKE